MNTAAARVGRSVTRNLFGRTELSRLIAPSSIALVGASTTPGSFGLRTLENIGQTFAGKLYPVNPRYRDMSGRACYPSLEELPEVPDCVIVAVPREHVESIAERSAALGVGGLVLYSAGYAELGTADGIAAQQRLTALAQSSGMRILGPNCVGIVNCDIRAGMTFMPKFLETPMVDGTIGLVSQSGGLGYVVLQAMERGVGFSHLLTSGNSCDVDVADLINYLVEDDRTKVVACMLEGISDGERFLEAGRRALQAGKPLLVYKMGNSDISRRTALSHTGTLAGSTAAYRAAFSRTGIVPIDNWEELLETAGLFAAAGRPAARGVGIMANSGGAAVMGADKAEEYGIELPTPAPTTKARMAKVIPSFGSNANPSDITAESLKGNDMFEECIRAFDGDPGFGAIIVPMLSAHKPATVDRAAFIAKLAPTLIKPICIVWINEWYQGPGSEHYDACPDIAMFRSMGRCLKALRLWIDYYERRDGLLKTPRERITTTGAAAKALSVLKECGSNNVLSEAQSKRVIGAYGVTVTRERLVRSAEEAVSAANEVGYPVVMKADSPDIPHKTEAGVVRLDVATADGVRAAYADIVAAVERIAESPRLAGITIQEMVMRGAEMMIGARQDPQFGPLITCGFGGIAVEVKRDVAIALAPVSVAQAEAMIRSLAGYRLLTGFRKTPPLDIQAFAEIVCRVSELVADMHAEIAEIDVNPVILRERGATAVDALIVRCVKEQPA